MMIAGMDSPDRNPIVPNSDSQGSPFFHFLCNLSPIKPVKSSFAAHTYSELSFPPPPAIFVSPKAESGHKDYIRSRRKIFTGISDTAAKEIDGFDGGECPLLPSNFQDNAVRSLNRTIAGSDKSSTSERSNEFTVAHRDAAVSTDAAELQNTSEIKRKSISHKKAGPIDMIQSEFSTELSEKQASEEELVAPSTGNNNMAASNSIHDPKRMKASWPSILTVQLTKVLAPAGDLVEDNPPTANRVGEVCMATSLNENETQHDKSNSRVSIDKPVPPFTQIGNCAGVRRRCLDFETLNNPTESLDDFPILTMLTDKSDFSDSSDDVASRIGFHNMHEGSNMPFLNLLPGYSMNDPSFASRIDALYLPFQSKLELISKNPDDSEISHTTEPIRFHNDGLFYKAQLLATNGCGLSMSAAIDNYATHVPENGCSASPDIQSLGSDYDKNKLDIERTFSTAETMIMDQKEGGQLISPDQSPAVHYTLLSNIQTFENRENTEPKNDFPHGNTEAVFKDIPHQSESDTVEELSHSPRSPKKKRKLAIQAADVTGEGCKNCKCKKSKCLKLYCECFAAGVYCVDVCNCTDCFNKPEFEETVLETRQQIESRNPLAFLPKIVRAVESTPIVGEECLDTPRSARHKRGCNCKKSQCLKKYCECYQAGVGCADGCRCEGCRNIFGRNEDLAEADGKTQQTASPEKECRRNDEIISIDSWPTPEQESQQNNTVLSPITPYLGHSGQCKLYAEPVSRMKSSSPFTPKPPNASFSSPCRLLESSDEFQSVEQMQLTASSCNFADGSIKITNLGGSLNDWNSSRDIYHKPLPQLSPGAADIVLDKINSCHDWLKHDDSISNSSFQLPHLTSHEPFLEQLVPLILPSDIYHFQTSEETIKLPVTPMLPSLPRRNYSLEETPDTPSLPSIWISDEDKSPNILKDSNSLCAPEVVLNTRSPQQKRVFSHQSSLKSRHLKDIVSSGSGFKNGRRFILQSLPSSTSTGNHRA